MTRETVTPDFDTLLDALRIAFRKCTPAGKVKLVPVRRRSAGGAGIRASWTFDNSRLKRHCSILFLPDPQLGGWRVRATEYTPMFPIPIREEWPPERQLAAIAVARYLGSLLLFFHYCLLVTKSLSITFRFTNWVLEDVEYGMAVPLQQLRHAVRLARAAVSENAGKGAGSGSG